MTKKQKSYYPKSSQIEENWVVINAENKVLGRLASNIANIVMGKNKATYSSASNDGDYVIVTNVEKLRVTGNKRDQKIYYTHSGQPGKLKEIQYKVMAQKKPAQILMLAVKGMLPKNALGRQMLKKVRLFEGETHTHMAQKPVELNF